MINLYDYVSDNTCFQKLVSDDLMLAHYKCLLDQSLIPVWSHNNCFVYVLSGSDRWITEGETHVVNPGDMAFIRRGAYLAQRCSEEDFNAILLFASDAALERVLRKYSRLHNTSYPSSDTKDQTLVVGGGDEVLTNYFHSLASYFRQPAPPAPELLQIRFEELLLYLLTATKNERLRRHFQTSYHSSRVSISQIMESSFMFNMSLEEYARLCARSLTSFKADFYQLYHTTPGKWLMTRRLQYAKFLLETTDDTVGDVAFKSGFKNTTHFVRVFKDSYGMPPLKYRVHMQTEAA